MICEFLTEARDELWEAALFYDSKEPGLGTRFRDEVANVVQRIVSDPELWRERDGCYRRVNCPVFSYYLAYITRKDRIVIIAVAHSHRKPGYWKSRLDG